MRCRTLRAVRPGRIRAALLVLLAIAVARGLAAADLDEEEVDRLKALGYVDVVDPKGRDLRLGVLSYDRERAWPGLNYFTNARGCSSVLMRLDGEVVRRWQHGDCFAWMNTLLREDGSVLAIHRRERERAAPRAWPEPRWLLSLGPGGEPLWQRSLRVHHDADLLPDGRVAVLTYRNHLVPAIHASIPIRDNGIAILGPDGELIEEALLSDLMRSAPGLHRLRVTRPRGGDEVIDLFHANSIEWMSAPGLAERDPLYAGTNVLVCVRHQDSVAIFDWQRKQLVWAWGQGELSGPHDATLLENGNVLVFDNGIRRQWSRVVEVDPRTGQIVWQYRAPDPRDFYSLARGAAQRLPNGNTLITDSGAGRAFEVTREGEIVWDFRNPNLSGGGPLVIERMRRLPEPGSAGGRYTPPD